MYCNFRVCKIDTTKETLQFEKCKWRVHKKMFIVARISTCNWKIMANTCVSLAFTWQAIYVRKTCCVLREKITRVKWKLWSSKKNNLMKKMEPFYKETNDWMKNAWLKKKKWRGYKMKLKIQRTQSKTRHSNWKSNMLH